MSFPHLNHTPWITTDGILVHYYRSNDHHILSKDDTAELRMRMQRIHWIKPIIEGDVRGKVFWKDCNNDDRVYFLPQLMYIVVLNKNKDGSFQLNTAYRITKLYKRLEMEKLFGL